MSQCRFRVSQVRHQMAVPVFFSLPVGRMPTRDCFIAGHAQLSGQTAHIGSLRDFNVCNQVSVVVRLSQQLPQALKSQLNVTQLVRFTNCELLV